MLPIPHAFLLAVFATFVCSMAVAESPKQLTNALEDDWRWFEDYAFTRAKYEVVCAPGCRCEIATGVKFFDIYLGGVKDFTNKFEVMVYGFGSVYIRRKEGSIDCSATLSLIEKELIKLPNISW